MVSVRTSSTLPKIGRSVSDLKQLGHSFDYRAAPRFVHFLLDGVPGALPSARHASRRSLPTAAPRLSVAVIGVTP